MKKAIIKKVIASVVALQMIGSLVYIPAFADNADTDAEIAALSGIAMTPDEAKEKDIISFPGADGGGKYATGGRGGEVYIVTNLNDSGEGSFRDAVSQPNRTVVFAVSGNIELKSPVVMTQPNITIAGQTSPGGVCLANYHLQVAADNLIIRYMRFRPGDVSKEENDAIWGRYKKNIIVDHCSSSWSTDETISIYAVADTTVQWCIGSESLTLAAHAKGRHGYGGIWGGSNVTYHHNLVATHTSRLPRYAGRASAHPDYEGLDDNDMVNNVIYNWGFNNSYGAENAVLNVVNNYYKPGPITIDAKVGSRIFNPSNGGTFYFSGNVVEGSDEVTADNLKGVHPQADKAEPTYLTEPCYDHLTPMTFVQTAEEAYESVLAEAGATVPMRDAYDAKVINDVRNSTGRAINNESEVGGWQALSSDKVIVDTDKDGIPDEWELKHGLDPNNSEDGKILDESGYSNLELYFEDLINTASTPNNPDVFLNIENNSIYNYGDSITLTASAEAFDGRTVEKIEYFDGDTILGVGTGADYNLKWDDAKEGLHYIMAKATDSKGESTVSEVKVISVNYTTDTYPWIGIDIGENVIPGSSAYVDGKYIVKSAGLIGPDFETQSDAENDNFRFMYQTADKYSEISTQIAEVSKLNNNCVTGIMFRDELTSNSDFALINYEYEKGGAGLSFRTRINGVYNKEFLVLEELPRYVKLYKDGNTVKAYHSANGIDWTYFTEAVIEFSGENYAGVAVDGNKEQNDIYNYTSGTFADLTLNNYGESRPWDVEIALNKNMFDLGDTVELDVNCADETDIEKADVYVDGEIKATEINAPFKFELSGIGCGSHFVTAVLTDKSGKVSSATVNIGVSKLEDGWNITNIGDTSAMCGAVDMNGSDITLYGCGFGVDKSGSEEYPYIYKKASGDFIISFKVDEQTLADYEQMGIVLKKELDDKSESYVGYHQIYNGELFKKCVDGTESYTQIGQQKYKKVPAWICLSKTGNTLKFSYSQNGSEWIDVGEEEIDFDEYYIGIFGASAEENACIPFKISEFDAEFSDDEFALTDLDGFEWAKNEIMNLCEKGIINGNGDGTFAPGNNVTRAEFIKMLDLALELDMSGALSVKFNDVDTSDWFFEYVMCGVENQITSGTSENLFEPNANITREEMITMIYRAIVNSGKAPSAFLGDKPSFKDLDNVSDWALEAVQNTAGLKIVNGDENGMLMPKANATRAEAAKIISNMLFALK